MFLSKKFKMVASFQKSLAKQKPCSALIISVVITWSAKRYPDGQCWCSLQKTQRLVLQRLVWLTSPMREWQSLLKLVQTKLVYWGEVAAARCFAANPLLLQFPVTWFCREFLKFLATLLVAACCDLLRPPPSCCDSCGTFDVSLEYVLFINRLECTSKTERTDFCHCRMIKYSQHCP